MIPLIGLMYKTFGKYRKENIKYFEESEYWQKIKEESKECKATRLDIEEKITRILKG